MIKEINPPKQNELERARDTWISGLFNAGYAMLHRDPDRADQIIDIAQQALYDVLHEDNRVQGGLHFINIHKALNWRERVENSTH